MDPRSPPLLRGLPRGLRRSEITLWHRELLGRRLFLNSAARFLVSGAIVSAALVAGAAGFLEVERATWVGMLGLAIGLYNVPIFLLARRYRAPGASAGAAGPLLGFMYGAIVADFLALGVLVTLMGGVRSPFLAFYLLHVALSCVALTRRAAVAFTVLALALISAQVGLEWAGVLHSAEPLQGVLPARPLDGRSAVEILLVYGALLGLLAALLLPVVQWLRESEEAIRERNRRLDQLSALRRDFLHVAVHNLRTPVGAALMHLDNLSTGLAGPLEPRQQEWVDRSRARLAGLLKLLQDLKTLGDLETESMQGKAEPVLLEEIVDRVAQEYQEMADAAGLLLVPEGTRPTPAVRGIPRLLREALANYVTNAIHHAPGTGSVGLRTVVREEDGTWVRVSVEDHGPGIPAEHQHRLFREFSRPPGSGQGEHRTGAALGLSLVRRIVKAHGGRVGTEPREDGGSIFWLELPADPGLAEDGGEEGEKGLAADGLLENAGHPEAPEVP